MRHITIFLLVVILTGCSNYATDLNCTKPITSITINRISAQTEAQSQIVTDTLIYEAKKHFTVTDNAPITLSGSVVFGNVYGEGSINSGTLLIKENNQQIGFIDIQPTWLCMDPPGLFSEKIIKILKTCKKKS